MAELHHLRDDPGGKMNLAGAFVGLAVENENLNCQETRSGVSPCGSTQRS